VDDVANAWLVHGVLPRHDLACEGIPLPERNSSDASVSSAARSAVVAPAAAPPAVVAPAVVAPGFTVPSGMTPQVWEQQRGKAPLKHR
jgi:hypothetical protein